MGTAGREWPSVTEGAGFGGSSKRGNCFIFSPTLTSVGSAVSPGLRTRIGFRLSLSETDGLVP